MAERKTSKDKQKRSSLSKSDIGGPSSFEHRGHIGCLTDSGKIAVNDIVGSHEFSDYLSGQEQVAKARSLSCSAEVRPLVEENISRRRSSSRFSGKITKDQQRSSGKSEKPGTLAVAVQTETCTAITEENTAEAGTQTGNSFRDLKKELEVLEKSLTDKEAENSSLGNEVRQLRREKSELEEKARRDQELIITILEGRQAPQDQPNEVHRAESETFQTIPSAEIFLTETKLGHGSYAEVRAAYWLGTPVAVKMLYEFLTESDRNIDLFRQEATLAWKTHHPHVASVCGVVLELEDEKRAAWLVMELLQGTVNDVLEVSWKRNARRLTLRESADMVYDSLCGICYLHSPAINILHGDIRPTNILVTATMTAKIGDLGAARLSDAKLSAGPVSLDYTAPERLDGRSSTKSKETDIYSMGVTICEIFTGHHPDRKKRESQKEAIDNEQVKSLCKRILQNDPHARPKALDAVTSISDVQKSDEYKGCPPKRMVKGILDGSAQVELTESM